MLRGDQGEARLGSGGRWAGTQAGGCRNLTRSSSTRGSLVSRSSAGREREDPGAGEWPQGCRDPGEQS